MDGEQVHEVMRLPWLEPWLESVQLSHCLKQAAIWCESMGAMDPEEVKDNWEDFAAFLRLDAAERASLTTSSSTGSSGHSGEASSGDPAGERSWLESMQLPPEAHPAAPSGGLRQGRGEVMSFGPEADPYRLLERLGKGANAVVHRCERGGEHFAAKVINLERLRMRPNFAQILKVLDRETSILWTMHHERIVQLRDVVKTPTRLYLVMDLVEGGELMDYIMSRGRVPEEEARYIFVQIVAGLMYIHGKSIVHRDLKPENILVDSAASRPGLPEVRLSDFGHSKLINDGYTCAHTVVGTPQYWAPEAAEAHLCGPRGYDERADLWSLGVVLYVMLQGCYPFDTTAGAHSGHLVFHGCSREAEQLVRGLIQVVPSERLTLDQCLESSWVAGGPRKLLSGVARSRGPTERELRVRLPRAPQDVALFRADLAAFANEHRASATLQLLEVVVCLRPVGAISVGEYGECAAQDEQHVHVAISELIARHFPAAATAGKHPAMEEQEPADEDAEAARAEEQGSLAAIYGPEFEALDDRDWRLQLCEGYALRLHLPSGYPHTQPPALLLEGPRTERAANLVKELLAGWAPGDGCLIYQWAERLRESLGGLASSTLGEEQERESDEASGWEVRGSAGGSAAAGGGGGPGAAPEPAAPEDASFTFMPLNRSRGSGPKSVKQGQKQRTFTVESANPLHRVDIHHGGPLVDKKSTFQAHFACVCTIEQVNWAHRQLLSDKKIGAATHNTVAYRIRDSASGSWVVDYDDDHEHGAGAILATLLEFCDQGIFVMVTRCFGGIELGPERFRHIKRVAQRLLENHGVLKQLTAQKKGPMKRKG